MVGTQKLIINLWFKLMNALRAHIIYLFLKKFYTELKKAVKMLVTFSFSHKSFLK